MSKQELFFEVSVDYSGTKTYRIPVVDGVPETLKHIADGLNRLDKIYNPFHVTETVSLASIEYQEWKD